MPIQKPDKQFPHDPRNFGVAVIFSNLFATFDGVVDKGGRKSANDLEKLLVKLVRPLLARTIDKRNLRNNIKLVKTIIYVNEILKRFYSVTSCIDYCFLVIVDHFTLKPRLTTLFDSVDFVFYK